MLATAATGHGQNSPSPGRATVEPAGRARLLRLREQEFLLFAQAGELVERALNEVPLQVPWLQIGVVVLLAALAGLLASVLLARRAARVTPGAWLSLD